MIFTMGDIWIFYWFRRQLEYFRLAVFKQISHNHSVQINVNHFFICELKPALSNWPEQDLLFFKK
jgi:hypothetical protein